MASDTDRDRILGTMRAAGDTGVLRLEDRFDTDIDDLWQALTDPPRLRRWIGEIDGDLRVGGEFSAMWTNSGEQRRGRVEQCDPPQQLRVTLHDDDARPGQPAATFIHATLTTAAEHTILVIEESGLPLPLLPAYGAGVQIHLENLGAYIAGREPLSAEEEPRRWETLLPVYQSMPIADS